MIEIPKKEARGKVAEIYDDIRTTLDMSMVNTIWRNLALKRRGSPVDLVFPKADLSERFSSSLRL